MIVIDETQRELEGRTLDLGMKVIPLLDPATATEYDIVTSGYIQVQLWDTYHRTLIQPVAKFNIQFGEMNAARVRGLRDALAKVLELMGEPVDAPAWFPSMGEYVRLKVRPAVIGKVGALDGSSVTVILDGKHLMEVGKNALEPLPKGTWIPKKEDRVRFRQPQTLTNSITGYIAEIDRFPMVTVQMDDWGTVYAHVDDMMPIEPEPPEGNDG